MRGELLVSRGVLLEDENDMTGKPLSASVSAVA